MIKGPTKKPVKGYEGLYEIYLDGRLWSIKKQKFSKLRKDGRYTLSCGGKDRNRKLTTLVREHFYVQDKGLREGTLCCCEGIEDATYGWRVLKEYPSYREAAADMGVQHTSISRGVDDGWLIGGYKWIFRN